MMIKRLVIDFCKDEAGATAIEYGLLAALIAAIIFTAVGAFGQLVVRLFGIAANIFP